MCKMGLSWSPKYDMLRIEIVSFDDITANKQTVTPDIARIFDRLGLMGAVILKAKIFLQPLWILKLGWKATLPQEIHTH